MPEEPFALNLPAPQLAEDDYDAVHAAVMETARGRWFLEEYGRRNRSADTTVLLSAIERIDSALKSQVASQVAHQAAIAAPPPAPAPVPPQPVAPPAPFSSYALHELRDAIMLTKESLPAVDPQGRVAFKPDFGRIPTGIATAADRMRASAENVQETAWFLRERAEQERGALKDALEMRCNELEAQARELTLSGAHLDQMSEAAAMIAALLAELETRFDEIIAGVPDAAPVYAPAAPIERPAPAAAVAVEKPTEALAPIFSIPVSPEPVIEASVAPPPAITIAVEAPATQMPTEMPAAMPPEAEAVIETAPEDEPHMEAPPPAFVDIPPISTTIAEKVIAAEPAPAAPIDEPKAVEPVPAAPEPVFDIILEIAALEPPVANPALEIPEPPAPAGPAPAMPALAFDIISEIAALGPIVAVAAPPPPAPAPQPQATFVATKAEWMDKLAPQVRGRFTSDAGPPAKVSFDFDAALPAIAMPNPARREMPGADLVPPPVRPEPMAAPQTASVETVAMDIVKAEIVEPAPAKIDVPIPLVMRFEIPPVVAEPVPEAIAPEPEPPLAAVPETAFAPEPEPTPEPAAPPELELAPAFRTAVLLPDEAPSDDPIDPAAYLFDLMSNLALPEAEAELPAPSYSNGSEAHDAPTQPAQPLKPADALAPIMALSDEEKIALFS